MNTLKLKNKKETEILMKEVFLKKAPKTIKRTIMKTILEKQKSNFFHSKVKRKNIFIILVSLFISVLCLFYYEIVFLDTFCFEFNLSDYKRNIQIESITLITITMFSFLFWVSLFLNQLVVKKN